MFSTLISAEALQKRLYDPDWVIVDCRFDLTNTALGRQQYHAAHIPGAVYAHLEDDLSGPPLTDHGRHPLPAPEVMIELFSRLGIDDRVQVAAYDANNGVYASRLWWMLRYLGHEAVAVLDGGWAAWEASKSPTATGIEANEPRQFSGKPRREWLVQMAQVPDLPLLVDSRGEARYRGEVEPLDKKAGHIPGAVNFFYQRNWSADGRYLPKDEIRQNLADLLGDRPGDEAVFYCGSGVSACVNLLALTYAGLGDGRLYVGSWSDWITDPQNPIATG